MENKQPVIPIGIVGLNFGGHMLGQFCEEPATRFLKLAAVCDMDAQKAAHFGGQYSVAQYTSLDALLANPHIPAIGLYTGPVGRADILRKIIRAGKDVLTTKPFELDPQAARDVLLEAKALGRIIHLNSPAPCPTQTADKIREWERRYDLGRPVFCRGETTADYSEQADGSWYDDPEKCPAAPIFRLGIYSINQLVSLYGPVEQVQVLSSRIRTGRPTADNAQLSLRFRQGMLGSVYASFCVGNGQQYADSLLLHYERGTITVNTSATDYNKAWETARLELVATPANGAREVIRDTWTGPGESGRYQWEAFYNAVSHRDTNSMPVEAIVSGIEVIQAMVRAEKTGRTETISPLQP